MTRERCPMWRFVLWRVENGALPPMARRLIEVVGQELYFMILMLPIFLSHSSSSSLVRRTNLKMKLSS